MSESIDELMARMESAAKAAEASHASPWLAVESSNKCGYPHNEASTLDIESDNGTPVAGTTIFRTRPVGFYIAAGCPANVLRILDELRDTRRALDECAYELSGHTGRCEVQGFLAAARAEREKEQG